jgi:N-acetylmuramoyl-L-alanine amidase
MLPVVERDGRDYVGLLEVLEPLGTVTAQAGGSRWKIRYNDTESEFNANKTRGRVQNRDFDLTSNFLLENGRGLVPLNSLSTLLPAILGGPVTYHENSRRLYIGSVAVHFVAQIANSRTPALVMNFTSPVNPRIATEPGSVQMLFTHEPLMPPGSTKLTFDSKTIPSATYSENNGTAEINITAHSPLFVSFSNDGRTITLSTVAQAKAPEAAPAITPPAENAAAPANAAPAGTPPAPPPVYFAVVDASHGGEETGAALSTQVLEKDVTLALSRRLKEQLEGKGLPTLILRDGDNALTIDQRANLANQAHAKIYLSVHASSLGMGTRVYTGWLPPAGGENSGPFLSWNTAQAGFLQLSQALAGGMTREFQKAHIPVRLMAAPLRPLNNIATAAVALEVAPPASNLAEISSAEYQSQVADKVASAIADMRGRLESGK